LLPRRPVLLLIDVEPDLRSPEPGRDGWEGTRLALPLLAELRRALEQRTRAPVVLNWFYRLDPQIERVWGRVDHVRTAVPELLEHAAAHGDYAGIHPHLWRWSEHDAAWYGDLEDRSWMRRCVDVAIVGFRALFGTPPEACRFGDRWSSDAALRVLAERGIRYELGVEPGRPRERPPGGSRARGWLPATHEVPRLPFARDVGPAGPIWILPLTTSERRWQPSRAAPFLVLGSVSPNLALAPPLVGPHLSRELGRRTVAPLVLVLRSGDLASRWRRASFRRNAARLLDHPGLARCVLTTPPDAIERWRAAVA